MEKVDKRKFYKINPKYGNKANVYYDEICTNNLNSKKMKTENKELQFKTNINCVGCVAKVTPFLNGADGIGDWKVDTINKDKILSVNSVGITKEEVIKKVQEAGFKIELLN